MNSRIYRYKAITNSGQLVRGSTQAINEQNLFQQLKDKNQYLISCQRGLTDFIWKPKLPTQELLDFCLHMQYMEQAGVPLLDALQDAHDNSLKLRPTINHIINDVKAGKMLSEAMAQHPKIFTDIFPAILQLSEQSGQLAQGFKTLYEHLCWTESNKRQLSKSLQYPGIIFLLICLVMWVLNTLVVPQMADLIKVSGIPLPPTSAFLLNLNQGLMEYTPRVLLLLLVGILALIGLRHISHNHRTQQDRLLLKLPLMGQLLQRRDITLYLHFFQVCLHAQVDLLECMDYAQKSVRNHWLKERLVNCIKDVREGTTLSQAMIQAGIFDKTCLRMVQIGEVTGQLAALLSVVEDYQSRDLKRQIEKFLTFLQPALLGIIGLMLIWIVMGIFYPIYDQMLVLEA